MGECVVQYLSKRRRTFSVLTVPTGRVRYDIYLFGACCAIKGDFVVRGVLCSFA